MKKKKILYISPAVTTYEYLIEQGFAGSGAPLNVHIEPQEYQYQRNENNWGWNWNTPTE